MREFQPGPVGRHSYGFEDSALMKRYFILMLLLASSAVAQVAIYPATYTMPQSTRLPIMCDPTPCSLSIISGGGSLDAAGTYTAPSVNVSQVVIRASKTGSASADAHITVSGTLPALIGCASGYPNSGTTPNQCSFMHQELSGTAKRYFNVVVPNQINSNTTIVVNVGSTGHGVANFCSATTMTQAGNEITGWGPLLLALPLSVPNAILVCAEGGWRNGPATPELQNYPGVGVSSWVSDHGSTTAVVPDENDFIEKVIQYVTRDFNVDARKVLVTNDWRFGVASYVGLFNSPLVSTVATWADAFGQNLDKNFTVLAGAGSYAGQTIQPPSVPMSYFNLASQFTSTLNPNIKSMCGTSDGIHPLTVDDILTFYDRADSFTSSSTSNKMCLYDAQGNVLYNANGIGRASTQETKCLTGGKAGTAACIVKMRVGPKGDEGSVHVLPYTAPFDWNGGTSYIVANGTIPLDLRASQQTNPCSSATPCNSSADASHGPFGIDTVYSRYLFHLNHGKPPVSTSGGTAPSVALNPTTLSFGNQGIGTTSSGKTATITNTGTATLNFTGMTITGDYALGTAPTNPCPLGSGTSPPDSAAISS
jgi:hypothetical protein